MQILSKQSLIPALLLLCSSLVGLAVVATEENLMNTAPTALSPCPESPNCVSSQAEPSDSHYIAPLSYHQSREGKTRNAGSAIEQVATVLSTMKRVNIVSQTDRYLKAEFTSAIFRFVDDVEFLVDDEGKLQVRSASRVGYSDFNANAKRVARIRGLLAQ